MKTRRLESGIATRLSKFVRRGREGNWVDLKWERLGWSKSVNGMVIELNWIEMKFDFVMKNLGFEEEDEEGEEDRLVGFERDENGELGFVCKGRPCKQGWPIFSQTHLIPKSLSFSP